jgi:hypothetical protein
MNLPRFTAEAAVYRPREAYRTVPVARHDTAASVTPATAADRIDGLDAVRDYITRLEFATLKRKLTLPPSWPASPGPPSGPTPAEAKYKYGLFYNANARTGAVARPARGELDVLWISRSSTSKPISGTARISAGI